MIQLSGKENNVSREQLAVSSENLTKVWFPFRRKYRFLFFSCLMRSQMVSYCENQVDCRRMLVLQVRFLSRLFATVHMTSSSFFNSTLTRFLIANIVKGPVTIVKLQPVTPFVMLQITWGIFWILVNINLFLWFLQFFTFFSPSPQQFTQLGTSSLCCMYWRFFVEEKTKKWETIDTIIWRSTDVVRLKSPSQWHKMPFWFSFGNYSTGKLLSKLDAERILHLMVTKKILSENTVMGPTGFPINFVRVLKSFDVNVSRVVCRI